MKYALAFAAMIFLTSAGAFLIKTGVSQAAAGESHLAAIMSIRVCAGIASFAASALVYTWLLRWLPLFLVQSIGAAQFMASVFVAAAVLGEKILVPQWAGIALIVAGITLVASNST